MHHMNMLVIILILCSNIVLKVFNSVTVTKRIIYSNIIYHYFMKEYLVT